MNSQRELKYSKRWADRMLVEFGIWSERLVDAPVLTSFGLVAPKKPFDRLFACKGVAAEFKFEDGRSFNLKSWREKPKTRHQLKNLKAFHACVQCFGVLIIFWKRSGKIVPRFLYADSEVLQGDRVRYEDMECIETLEKEMDGLRR